MCPFTSVVSDLAEGLFTLEGTSVFVDLVAVPLIFSLMLTISDLHLRISA